MERHAKFFIVSCFIALSIAGLILFNLWISSPGTDSKSSDYPILFRGAVSGLSVGSDVRYLGVSIGRVTDINISAKNAGHVEIIFNSNQTIPASDLIAQLEPQGITGLSIIELRLKSDQDPGFETQENTIPGYPSLISQLSGSATNFGGSASSIVSKVDNLLSNENITSLSNSMQQLDQTTANLANVSGQMTALFKNISQASLQLEKTLVTYGQVGDKVNNELLPAIQLSANELSQTAISAKKILNDNAPQIKQLFSQDIPTLMGISDELSQSLKGINELSNGLDNDPTQLIYGKRLPEMEVNLEH
ncbi:MAG: phospholipid/cholesterol/gamma-HCH transport system substrate-binding protein [Pseudohongiellaceae bacterium]|jgi:phospholipid/cholesterol/gamma-HCH transport system substrate-binding protein